MHQVWGHPLHHQWTFLLKLSAHHQCRRSWRCASCVHQGLQHRMASHDKELGSELAEQCQLGCSELVLHGHHWWWPNSHIHECGTCLLVLWTNIWGLSVFMTKSILAEQSLKSLHGTRVELQLVQRSTSYCSQCSRVRDFTCWFEQFIITDLDSPFDLYVQRLEEKIKRNCEPLEYFLQLENEQPETSTEITVQQMLGKSDWKRGLGGNWELM